MTPDDAQHAPPALVSRNAPRLRRRRADVAVVLLPVLAAGALASYQLTGRSIWIDEAASVTIAAQHGAALGAAMAHDGGNMLGYYALLHVLIGAFGNGLLVVRIPSVIATAATAGIVATIAGRLFGRRVALAAGMLSAASLPLVYWGQNARGYAPMVALVAGSYLALLVLAEPTRNLRDGALPLAAYVLITTAAVYMSFVAALVVPAQLLALAVCRRRLRLALAGAVASAACCAPLAVLAVRRGSGQLFWVPKPNVSAFAGVARSLMSAAFQPNFALTATSNVLVASSLAVIVAAWLVAARAVRRGGEPAFAHVLLASWLVVPVLLVWAESSIGQSLFLSRNLLVALPPVGIILAWALVGPIADRSPRWRVVGMAGVAALLTLRSLQLAPSYGVSPENWKAAAASVLARSSAGDCIAFYPSDGRMAFEYYVGEPSSQAARAPRSVLPVLAWGIVKPYVEQYTTLSAASVATLPARCTRLWLVTSHVGQQDGTAVSRLHLRRYRRLAGELASAYANHTTVAFGYASPVDVELLSR